MCNFRLKETFSAEDRNQTLVNASCSTLAGMAATAITQPMDVLRTRTQLLPTQVCCVTLRLQQSE